jgi:hypothetical protein
VAAVMPFTMFRKAMTASPTAESAPLKPSYNLPIALLLGSLGWGSLALVMFGVVQVALAGLVFLFGLFLLYQTATLRLVFTTTDLDIYRGDQRIRRFPYAEWEIWEIFWSPVPILFYFREVNSIHFLPILFNPDELRSQLTHHLPDQADSR